MIEKAKTCGGHIMSGAVMRPGRCRSCSRRLTREDWRSERFAFGEVTKEAVYLRPEREAGDQGSDAAELQATTATR